MTFCIEPRIVERGERLGAAEERPRARRRPDRRSAAARSRALTMPATAEVGQRQVADATGSGSRTSAPSSPCCMRCARSCAATVSVGAPLLREARRRAPTISPTKSCVSGSGRVAERQRELVVERRAADGRASAAPRWRASSSTRSAPSSAGLQRHAGDRRAQRGRRAACRRTASAKSGREARGLRHGVSREHLAGVGVAERQRAAAAAPAPGGERRGSSMPLRSAIGAPQRAGRRRRRRRSR